MKNIFFAGSGKQKGQGMTESKETAMPKIIKNQMLKEYTTFRIGGPADFWAEPETPAELRAVLEICRNQAMPYFILGQGSNVLFTDKGYRGMVIFLGPKFSQIRREGETLRAGAGAKLKDVAQYALAEGLDGLVFACGIPGSIGGAVFMNAGAYDGEMKQVVAEVTAMDKQGNLHCYSGEEMNFGYRHSRIQDSGEIILEAVLHLQAGDRQAMAEKAAELTRRREEKQPLELASAGSTFRRPEGYFAGKLIMDAGLSGYSCGDAAVSTKHCGFVVNCGNASFADVMNVMEHVQKTVEEKFQVRLQPEVRIVGER